MGLVLTIDGSFPDATSEATFVGAVESLVSTYRDNLSTATLSTDFNGAPNLPVGPEPPAGTDDDSALAAEETTLAGQESALDKRVTALEGGVASILTAVQAIQAQLPAPPPPPAPPA